MKALLAKYSKKLFGVESRRALDDFDVLGFSLSYELGGTNILEMLRLSGIPVSWEVSDCVARGRLLVEHSEAVEDPACFMLWVMLHRFS